MENLMSIAEHSDWLEEQYTSSITKWNLHRQRVEFSKQKLEIWQFVPCKLVDGVWVVLEEPKKHFGADYTPREETHTYFVEYQKTKERCLFEGFEIKTHSLHRQTIATADNILHVFWSNGLEWSLSIGIKTIEDLVKYKPKLTATAKKHIGF